jgi:hypothetical protein
MLDSGSYVRLMASACEVAHRVFQAGPADVDRELPPAGLPICASLAEESEHLAGALQDLVSYLDRSVSLRVRDIPPIPWVSLHKCSQLLTLDTAAKHALPCCSAEG